MRLIFMGFAFVLFSSFTCSASAKSEKIEKGMASYYNLPGNTTASGARFIDGPFAAHRTLKLGTKVLVRKCDSGNFVIVTINDRGPFVRGVIIDLTPQSFNKLAPIKKGHVCVTITPLN